MKKLVLSAIVLLMAAMKVAAQEVTPQLTAFPEFRPATVFMADGKKMEGELKSADEKGFVVTVMEKQKIEGKKRPQMVEVDRAFGYGDVKWVKNIIDFK